MAGTLYLVPTPIGNLMTFRPAVPERWRRLILSRRRTRA